jgi:DNA-binding transcriptional MocR family regulator
MSPKPWPVWPERPEPYHWEKHQRELADAYRDRLEIAIAALKAIAPYEYSATGQELAAEALQAIGEIPE